MLVLLSDCVFVMADLSPSAEPSPSLEAEEVCLDNNRISSGSTSSLRWTVKDVLPLRPNPNLRLRPKPVAYYTLHISTHYYIHCSNVLLIIFLWVTFL